MNQVHPEIQLHVSGMDCPSCAATIQDALHRVPGVTDCAANPATGRVRVQGTADEKVIAETLASIGHPIEAPSPTSAPHPTFIRFLFQPENRLVLAAGVLAIPIAILNEALGIQHTALDVLAIIALVIAAIPVVPKAWSAITRTHSITIHVLMTIACAGAVIIGAHGEAAMVMVLFGVGEALEAYTSLSARRSIAALIQAMPEEALIEDESGTRTVPAESLVPGDRILIKPGARVPADGVILEGESTVDESSLTGESLPVAKQIDDEVFGGTMNHQGALIVGVTRPVKDSLLGRIIAMVQDAQDRKAPTERYVDQFARYYTPIVVLIAIVVAATPPLFMGAPFWGDGGWLYRGLALLVVACPCALVISTPVSIVSAITNAAKHGILFKSGADLETLARIRTLAMDKTGTLTEGRPRVARIESNHCENGLHPVDEHCDPCAEVIALAHAVERRSEHPLAHAIALAANDLGVQERYAPSIDAIATPGSGIAGSVGESRISIAASEAPACDPGDHGGCTAVAVQRDGQLRGTIHLIDTARPHTQEAIQAIRDLGVQHVVMLTGDNTISANAIAKEVGLSEVHATLKPDQKLEEIHRLQAESGPVAMTGDGINDAPALAAADVGIAMGGDLGGTAQAMETAGVTLASGDLRALPRAIALAKAALATIRTNIALSILIKVAFLIAVIAGVGTMWMAVLADMGTTLLVTLNAMRLLRWQP